MHYTALLFDLDDTLLDFKTAENSSLDKTYDAYFSPHCEREQYKHTFRRINVALWDLVHQGRMHPRQVGSERFLQLMKELKIQLNIKEVSGYYESVLGGEVIWFPRVAETLDRLKKKYKMGIITNGLTTVQEKKYQLSGLKKWFSCFLISEKVGLAKPDRRIFDLACASLAEDPQNILMIGDSLASDYRGALNTGIDFCWVNPAEAPLPSGWPPPQYVIKSVSELTRL